MSSTPEAAPLARPAKGAWRWAAPVSAHERARERLAWLLLLPSLVVVAVVALYPLFETFRLSLTNARLASTRETEYVGFENYRDIFSDDQFIASIWHTIVFTVSSVAIETVLGIIIALVIHSNFKGRGMLRASMLVPWAIPTVVSATMWNWMYHDNFGVINDFLFYKLEIVGEKVAWIANTSTALPAMIAIDIWKTTPFMALLLLAGLQIIPGDVYEAATVDGASKWQQFWQITLPLLRPALLVALIFRSLDAFRVFDLPYVLNQGATYTMTIAVYAREELIHFRNLGVGSAASVVIFLCVGVMVLIYTRLVRVEEV